MLESILSSLTKARTSSLILGGLVLLVLLGGVGYWSWSLFQQNQALSAQVKTLTTSLESAESQLNKIKVSYDQMLSTLGATESEKNLVAQQLDKVTQTVETFQRIAQVDPQLLQKYSKIYFLNENYKPSALTSIDTKYLVLKDKPLLIHDRIWLFLQNLLDASDKAGSPLLIVSAYRSFGTQASLKSSYRVTYGVGTANSFSADQGYSEHQLGTAVDFSTGNLGTNFSAFAKTRAYQWLLDNAYQYGFILSYPANNAYYVFEPWHWRFVGLDLAKLLHDQNKHFYDLDQRAINVYLATFFNGTTSGPLLP